MIDLVVVGGGPVGLAAAIEARFAGLSVVVIEPRTGPIDKACGEGLMPGAVPLLERLGLQLAGHPLAGVGYYDSSHRVEHRFTTGSGLGVRRTALHAALAERATELGVGFVAGRADAVEQHQDSVTVTVGDRKSVV